MTLRHLFAGLLAVAASTTLQAQSELYPKHFDLEQVTLARHPVLAELKAAMREAGAEFALMSGSGPTVFGIFTDEAAAKAACAAFAKDHRFACVAEPVGRIPQG